ncbi:MAG: tetratricopeptide repeat protein [Betaproteobacteria bacterium]|nr:MAG: tetratricopeptide repeat protein [Betaproteobacteria bacterium]
MNTLIKNLLGVGLLVAALMVSPAFAKGAGVEWDILNDEVLSLLRAGQYERGVVVAKKALAVAEVNVGENPPAVATSLNNLAELYRDQGHYGAAEPLMKRALAILEKVLGADHPDVALSLNNLAALYRATNRINDAEKLERRAARIKAMQR